MEMETQPMEQLTTYLTQNKYCLMVDDANTAIIDEDGQLLVCKAEDRNCMLAVPDCEGIRKLYDLPLHKEEEPKEPMLDVKVEQVSNEEDESIVEDEVETIVESGTSSKPHMVWLGQRSKKCHEATKALMEIYSRDEYQKLMNDNNTIKLKVWEKIASELEERGFKIANTLRDAGLRTFQKWRNMERTYWKYLNNPDLCGDDKRRKKPSFFDGVHDIISKRKFYKNDERDSKFKAFLPLKMSRIEMKSGAIEVLLRLMDSDKYEALLQGDSKNILAWEALCSELETKGFFVKGGTKREKSENLIRKWKNIKKMFLKYEVERKLKKDIRKPKYYDLTHKIVSKELIRLKSYEEIESIDVGECLQYDHDYDGTFEMGNMECETSAVCETLSCGGISNNTPPNTTPTSPPAEEATSIASPAAKTSLVASPVVKTLLVASPAVKTPMSVSPAVKTPMSVSPAPKESSTTPFVVETPLATYPEVEAPSTVPNSTPLFVATDTPKPSVQTTNHILLEIKQLHETALAVQQQNFTRIISVLEEQTGHLSKLNSLFTEYVTHRSNRSSSRHNHKNGVIK